MHTDRHGSEYKGSGQDNPDGFEDRKPGDLIDGLLKKSVRYTSVFVLGVCLFLVFMGKLSWAGGFLVGGAWATAELVLTFKVMRIAILNKDKRRLYAMLLVKFPVLYLAGILILISKIFPLASLLLGLLPIFIVTGTLRLCTPNFRIS